MGISLLSFLLKYNRNAKSHNLIMTMNVGHNMIANEALNVTKNVGINISTNVWPMTSNVRPNFSDVPFIPSSPFSLDVQVPPNSSDVLFSQNRFVFPDFHVPPNLSDVPFFFNSMFFLDFRVPHMCRTETKEKLPYEFIWLVYDFTYCMDRSHAHPNFVVIEMRHS